MTEQPKTFVVVKATGTPVDHPRSFRIADDPALQEALAAVRRSVAWQTGREVK